MYKICNQCNTEKQLSAFRRDSSRKDGYQHKCKECARKHQKSLYEKKYSQQARDRNAARRVVGKGIIDAARRDGCSLCNEDDLSCLQFHHIDPSKKEFQVGGYGVNFNLDRLRAEIEKCIVVCANCHMKIHAGRITIVR